MFDKSKKMIFISAFLLPLSAKADFINLDQAITIQMVTNEARQYKETKYNAKIVRYTDERKTYRQWLTEFRKTDHILNEQMKRAWNAPENQHIREDPEQYLYSKIIGSLSERRLADLWNTKIVSNPNSKNARSAFCSYGKDLIVFLNAAIVCDKNFVLDPQKHFVFNKDYPVKRLDPIE